MKICKIRGWDLIITTSLKKDVDFFNDFQLSLTLDNCWSNVGGFENGVTTHSKYFIFEIFNRRPLEIKLQKEVHHERGSNKKAA